MRWRVGLYCVRKSVLLFFLVALSLLLTSRSLFVLQRCARPAGVVAQWQRCIHPFDHDSAGLSEGAIAVVVSAVRWAGAFGVVVVWVGGMMARRVQHWHRESWMDAGIRCMHARPMHARAPAWECYTAARQVETSTVGICTSTYCNTRVRVKL